MAEPSTATSAPCRYSPEADESTRPVMVPVAAWANEGAATARARAKVQTERTTANAPLEEATGVARMARAKRDHRFEVASMGMVGGLGQSRNPPRNRG